MLKEPQYRQRLFDDGAELPELVPLLLSHALDKMTRITMAATMKPTTLPPMLLDAFEGDEGGTCEYTRAQAEAS